MRRPSGSKKHDHSVTGQPARAYETDLRGRTVDALKLIINLLSDGCSAFFSAGPMAFAEKMVLAVFGVCFYVLGQYKL